MNSRSTLNMAPRRALLSVSDKTGLIMIARFLSENGFELVATSSTLSFLVEHGLSVTPLQDVTRFPEILGGRVKTIHPAVFGGILGRPTEERDWGHMLEHSIQPIEIVICNLYPFQDAVQKGADLSQLIENIDIGGVSLIRAAAKNNAHVTCLCDPADYEPLMEAMTSHANQVPPDLRLDLAIKAFGETAAYDTVIQRELSRSLSSRENKKELKAGPIKSRETATESPLGEPQSILLLPSKPLRYGENPHQKAHLYTLPHQDLEKCSLANMECFHGKELSYNNLLDIEHSVRLAAEFRENVCVIVKHNVPCGVGRGATPLEAYEMAFEGDPVSPFGGVVTFNQPVDAFCAQRLQEIFLEVIIAPDFSDEAIQVLSRKKNLRLVKLDTKKPLATTHQWTQVQGGFLAQTVDSTVFDKEKLTFATKKRPTPEELESLRFGMTVVKHVRSNAIVLCNGTQTIAISGGFTNRVDAVEHCLKKARISLKGAILASDAFFPFPDSIELLKGTGIRHIIQPGGSVQDANVIEACDKLDLGMVLTGMRHFKH